MNEIINKSSGLKLADKADIANNFISRFRGLLGRKSLVQGEALIITQCKQVHMFGMLFSIDAIFCSSENIVLGQVESLAPWSISGHFHGASYVIELPTGTIMASRTQIGDKIEISSVA
ncbi:MAG: DUF192 domain-containing protein [Deltaproteobacteria bacterium]|nr:DUF192 domain-containing protein [Deltaproteobacteria bacterium]